MEKKVPAGKGRPRVSDRTSLERGGKSGRKSTLRKSKPILKEDRRPSTGNKKRGKTGEGPVKAKGRNRYVEGTNAWPPVSSNSLKTGEPGNGYQGSE